MQLHKDVFVCAKLQKWRSQASLYAYAVELTPSLRDPY